MNFDVSNISGVTADSRKVEDGFLFVAIKGVNVDGREFIAQAVQRGAAFIAVETGTPRQDCGDAAWIEVDDPSLFLADVAARFYAAQPSHIMTVTGTNGKTSTVNFARMILTALGQKAASLGTLGLIGEGLSGYAGMTTPDPVQLFATLKTVADKGSTHLAMEASSHGLAQHRLDGVAVKAAGFTNLTRDHLDYHGTMEDYFSAKLRLFTELVEEGGTIVLNADTPECTKIIAAVKGRNLTVITYGFAEGATLRVIKRDAVATGQDVVVAAFGKTYALHLNLVGAFQLMNVLCAVGLVLSDKAIAMDAVMAVLPQLEGVVGRLQHVPLSRKDIGVYVDYAHTPDGLETILNALRPHTKNRLICVFGCGGDRDKGKRPVMGEIATRLADVVIVTDDNPRSETPAIIRAEILVGAKNAIEIDGRRNAIREAVRQLQSGDVLVLAGKGHEEGQIFATHTEPFNDLTEAQTALHTLLS